ncbi:MAG: NusG domain II-containing protein [Eubacteriales bacterium]|nr:NusG domain II-containing protein [Eubacteriales bacterium]
MKDRQKKNDIRLVVVLLILAALSAGFTAFRRLVPEKNAGGPVAVVKLDGREVLRLSLGPENGGGDAELLFCDEAYVSKREDGGFYVYQKGTADPDGGMNVLMAENGHISCTEADCPDQVCVRTGSISLDTETIVCLPHKMIVTIFKEN